jgi:Galactose oxidase, central domain
MNELDFDRRLAAWLREPAPEPSDRILSAVVDHARVRAPARGLRALWTRPQPALGMRRPYGVVLRPVLLLILLTLAFALGGFVYASMQHTVVVVPTPLPTSTPAPVSFVCPPGTSPDQPGPVDQARPDATTQRSGYAIDETSGRVVGGRYAFDRQSGRVVLAGQTLTEGTNGGPATIWTFDVCTNAWRKSAVTTLPTVPSAMAYSEAADVTFLFGADGPGNSSLPVLAYDAEADSLTVRGELPDSLHGAWPLQAVYRAATGEVVVREYGSGALWVYDLAGTWRRLAEAGDIPAQRYLQLLAYDRSVDRLILYTLSADGTREPPEPVGYEFDFDTSAWTRQTVLPPLLPFPYGDIGSFHEMAYDEVHQRTVAFSQGQVIAYDATAQAWEVLFDSAMDRTPDDNDVSHRQEIALVYDPVNQRILSFGGYRWTSGWIAVDDVIAFDLHNRTWTTLLAQSGSQSGG